MCRNLDDPDKPKSWSKHSKGTAVHHKNSTSSISVKYNKLKGEQFKNESNKDETAQPNITERKSATGPKNKEVSEIFDKVSELCNIAFSG